MVKVSSENAAGVGHCSKWLSRQGENLVGAEIIHPIGCLQQVGSLPCEPTNRKAHNKTHKTTHRTHRRPDSRNNLPSEANCFTK